jgi:hypothetical protein
MKTPSTVFALLAFVLAAPGCALDAEPSSSAYELLSADAASYSADHSAPNVQLTQVPRVESFSAQPGVLPVGGGEVQLKWTSRYSVACSLLVEGRSIKVDSKGTFSLDVVRSTDLAISCFDEVGFSSEDIGIDVEVETVPVQHFDGSAESISLGSPDSITVAEKLNSVTPVEYEVTLEVNSQLLARATSEGMASDLTIWLVEDVNGDGQLEQDEVIDYSLTRPEVEVQDRLRAGTYRVIVIPGVDSSGFFLTLSTKPA